MFDIKTNKTRLIEKYLNTDISVVENTRDYITL